MDLINLETNNDDIRPQLRFESIKALLPFIRRIDADKYIEIFKPAELTLDINLITDLFEEPTLVFDANTSAQYFKGYFKSYILHQAIWKYWKQYLLE